MQSIIELLFINLMEDETDHFQRQIASDAEYAAYTALRNALNEAQKKPLMNLKNCLAIGIVKEPKKYISTAFVWEQNWLLRL